MSRKTDQLMLKLPLADVAEWLRAEFVDMVREYNAKEWKSIAELSEAAANERVLLRLIAKLGH
jgi:hypothetical protein